jgi:hypothetical protein
MPVADAKGRRFDAATGIGFAVLTLVGFSLPGTPPKADDPTAKISAFFGDHRKEILIGNFLLGLGAVLFLWFLGALRSYLRAGEGGEGRLSAAAFGGGAAGITLLLVGAGLLNAIAFDLIKEGSASDDLVRAVFDASGAVLALGGMCFAVFFGAASCSGARSGALPPWAYWSGSVVAGIQVVGGLALFATSGFFAAGGALPTFIAPLTALIWVVAVSVLMMRREGVPPLARTAP